MDFFVDDLVDSGETPEAALEAWLAEHPESYAHPARYTFQQVYLSSDRRGDALLADAERLLVELRSTDGTTDLRKLGDRSLLQATYADYRADMFEGSFGQSFAEQLAGLASGEWSGPVESSFGLHLVFIEASTPGRLADLAEVRDEVERDWRHAQRQEASKRFYEQVVSRYDVTVEWPQVNEEVSEDVNVAAEGPGPSEGLE